MPIKSIGREITRSTICVDRWTVNLTLFCADRIALNHPEPCLINVEWRKQQNDTDNQPSNTAPIIIELRKRSPASNGELRFQGTANPMKREFSAENERRLLTLEAVSASNGNEPDVEMVFHIDGKQRDIVPLSCGSVTTQLSIAMSDEDVELVDMIAPDTSITLLATVSPETAGRYHWFTSEPDRLVIERGGNSNTVILSAKEVNADSPWSKLFVLFQPDDGAAMTLEHQFEIVDLAQRFSNHLLHRRHLMAADYRVRLESLSAEEVGNFIARSMDAALSSFMQDYLQRLLVFVTQQAPLRQAPEENRTHITFIMGNRRWKNNSGTNVTDNFYRYAEAYYRANPDGDLIFPADLGVSTNRSSYNPHASIQQVLNYLRNNPPPQDGRWGRINIVSHADELGGMLAFVVPPTGNPDTFRANTTTLAHYKQQGALQELADDRADVRSQILIRGCALGRSQQILTTLSEVFGRSSADDQQRPQVYAPKHLQVFSGPRGWNPNQGAPEITRVDAYYHQFFLISLPSADVPNRITDLVPQFERNFPDVGINWIQALGHHGSPAGDNAAYQRRTRNYTYTYSFWSDPSTSQSRLKQLIERAFSNASNVFNTTITSRTNNTDGTVALAVSWEDLSANRFTGTMTVGAPTVSDTWLDAQSALVNDLAQMNFAHRDFTWNAQVLSGSSADGTKNFEVTGTRYIYRIEQELRQPDPDNPSTTQRQHPLPTELNSVHFGQEIPVSPPQKALGENVSYEVTDDAN